MKKMPWVTEKCSVCGGGFSEKSWDTRCTDPRDGLSDCHQRCCPQCNARGRRKAYKLTDAEATALANAARAFEAAGKAANAALLRSAIEILEKGGN